MKRVMYFFGVLSIICTFIFVLIIIEKKLYQNRIKCLTPFYSVLKDQGSNYFRGIFKIDHSELYYVGLVFQNNTSNDVINKSILNWKTFDLKPEDMVPNPDITWKIIQNKRLVAKGFGGQSNMKLWNGDVFICGTFYGKSGQTYEIIVQFGPRFRPFLRYFPGIEIGVDSAVPSIGLAWGEGINNLLTIIIGIAGLLCLLITTAIYFFLLLKKR